MAQSERVFQTYTSAQAEFYRKTRGTYNKTLYDFVLDRHVQSGGGLDQLVDVGCGPGSATADLATYFQRAIGVDPGAGMIQAAKEAGGTTRTGADIEYVVGVAEDLDQLEEIALQSTDLITAATCAHWFDMPKFWRAAENVLKPGGSVAIWIKASLLCHPDTPSAKEVQNVLWKLELDTLAPFAMERHHLSHNLYDGLTMPWDLETPIASFNKSDFIRQEWDRDGVLSDGKDFFGGGRDVTLKQIEDAIGTASPVARWRETYPDLAGTSQDCVVAAVDEIADILAPDSGRSRDTVMRAGVSTVVLIVKKRND